MIHLPLNPASRRRRFFIAAGLGVTLLTSSAALAQVQPGPGQEASAPGADRTAAPNQRATTNESQGGADQPAPERVIITGSFIPTAEGEGALPVSVFTQDDLRKQGANSAAEGLRRLPSFVGAANTENNSNGGNGTAGVNLRGLGQQNTLVLINGHRAGNPSLLNGPAGIGGFADVNAIPFSAIDHIEILKDGASAQYGSDAVAGVVNFVLKTQFQGAQVDFKYGNTTNNDAATIQADVITGFTTKDKRFNIVLDANYLHQNGIYSRDRFLSSVADTQRFNGQNSGSPTFSGRATATGLGDLVLINPATVPTSPADYRLFAAVHDPGAFNFHTFTAAIPEVERFSYYGATDYQVVEKMVDLYAFGIYSNNRQYRNDSAPSPGFFPGTLGRLSPFDPFSGQTAPAAANPTGSLLSTSGSAVRYRFVQELGPRITSFDHKYYDLSGGVKGDIKTFAYDLFLSHVEDKEVRTQSGDTRQSVINAAIANGTFNPFIGQSAPTTGTFTPTTGPLAGQTFSYDNVAAARAGSYIAQTVTFSNLNLAEARFTNTFFPDAPQGGVSVALGGEYRRESFDTQFDPVEQSGDTFGFNAGASFHAVQDVRSVFGELRFPIIAPTMNIPGVYNLSFGIAGRYQKFFLNGNDPLTGAGVNPTFETTNPKYELRFQPIPDVTFRASYSTAFRAPALSDLFGAASPGSDFPVLNDPFNGSQFQPALGDTTGGNPALQPETTDAYSAGIVLSPRFAPGLNITADYYQLNQQNVIISGGTVAQFVLNQNFNSSNKALFVAGVPNAFNDPNAQFASRVVRDPATGDVQSIDERGFNAARLGVEGIDVTVNYELPTEKLFHRDLGKFNFTLNYNHLFRFNGQTTPGQGFANFVGNAGLNEPLTPGSLPFNKALFQLEYQKDIPGGGIAPAGALDFVATVNYIGDYVDNGGLVNNSSVINNPATGQPFDPANPTFTRNRRVREYTTLDLQLSYTFKAPEKLEASTAYAKDGKDSKGGGKRAVTTPGTSPNLVSRLLGGTTLTFGCVNVADTPPPFTADSLNDNYDTSLYSIRNRFVYGAISKKF